MGGSLALASDIRIKEMQNAQIFRPPNSHARHVEDQETEDGEFISVGLMIEDNRGRRTVWVAPTPDGVIL